MRDATPFRELAPTKVQELKNEFARKTAEAESLKGSLQKAEEVLGAASEMLDKLSGERVRWDAMMAELNSGLDAMKLAATDPKEWMRAREDYDKRVAEDMILEGEGALTREDAFKYLGVLVVSFVGGRVFKQGKDDEGA